MKLANVTTHQDGSINIAQAQEVDGKIVTVNITLTPTQASILIGDLANAVVTALTTPKV